MPEGLSQAQIVARLERLERTVRLLAERTGVGIDDPSGDVDADIVALARAGRRMEAAKLYGERAGVGFVDAQRVVNGL